MDKFHIGFTNLTTGQEFNIFKKIENENYICIKNIEFHHIVQTKIHLSYDIEKWNYFRIKIFFLRLSVNASKFHRWHTNSGHIIEKWNVQMLLIQIHQFHFILRNLLREKKNNKMPNNVNDNSKRT